MKFLTVLCFFGIISYAEAISCHICSGLTECAESETESETDCSDVKSTNEENGIFEQDAHMCRIDWQLNPLDGAYNIIGRTCAFGRGGLEDHGVKDCHLQEDGNGYCYCNTDNCNVIPKILTNNASRITCYHCNGEQCNDDQDNFGIEVSCPIGVKRCVVTGNQWNDRFYRSCEWELHAENSDSFGDEQGYCLTMDDPNISHMCTCSTDKCNTGFHGPKCHVYKASNCGTKGPRIMGLDDESEPSVMNCLTGTKYCGSSQIDFHGFCQEKYFTCAVGITSATEEELDDCIEDEMNVANALPNATVCLCDAEQQEMCNPISNASNQLIVSMLAMISAVIMIRF